MVSHHVMPAKAGIQLDEGVDSRLRGKDKIKILA
jgi:hypothetical protein